MDNALNDISSMSCDFKLASSSANSGTVSTQSTNSTKSLPNIQPKTAVAANGSQRLIVPKQDASKISQQSQGSAAQQTQNNIIIPQGIQHVLINGQLYPIIQTANGTHLLIQQPVGQIQQASGGKHIFTAQPIQLTSLPGQQVPVQPGNQINGDQLLPTSNQHSTKQQLTIPEQNPISSASHDSSLQATQQLQMAATHSLPDPVSNSQMQQLPGTSSPIRFPNVAAVPVTISPQTQQVLTRLQSQIEVLKARAETDPAAKNNLQQLQQVHQQLLTELRNQMQQRGLTGSVLSTQSAMNTTQIIPGVQISANTSSPIVQSVQEGESPMTTANIAALTAAFMNVKVGAQAYNIQLVDDQKRMMIERMVKMTPEQQHLYVQQQQIQILSSAVGRPLPQQPLQGMPVHAGFQQTANQKIDSTSLPQSPKPVTKAKRRPPAKSKAEESSPVPSPSADMSDEPSKGKSSTPTRKARPQAVSSKRVGERMIAQIQKDQEFLLKAGNHKKPFVNKSQLCERLLRYHIYYTKDKSPYAKLQEAELFETIAYKMMVRKEEMITKFQHLLWKESVMGIKTEEDVLISQLLLQDEKEALGLDKRLEEENIDLFVEQYSQPVKAPTPPPQAYTTTDTCASRERSDSKNEPPETTDSNLTDDAFIKHLERSIPKRRGGRPCRFTESENLDLVDKTDINNYQKTNRPPSETQNLVSSENSRNSLMDTADKKTDFETFQSPHTPNFTYEAAMATAEPDVDASSSTEATDEEVDIVDIDEPSSPPRVQSPKTPATPVFKFQNVQNSNYSSSSDEALLSPKKGFSILSETVVAQSTGAEYVTYYSDVSDEDSDYGTLSKQNHKSYVNTSVYNDSNSFNNHTNPCTTSHYQDLSECSMNQEKDQDTTDVDEFDEHTDKDYLSEDENHERSSSSSIEPNHSECDRNDLPDAPSQKQVIAPIKINKRQLESFNWPDETKWRSEPPPIKLKITESVAPPPIKLRIKRAIYDNWKAASNIGSCNVESSDDESSEQTDTDDVINGGVTVDWDDNPGQVGTDESTDASDLENSQENYKPQRLKKCYENNYKVANESLPFNKYGSYKQSSSDEYDS